MQQFLLSQWTSETVGENLKKDRKIDNEMNKIANSLRQVCATIYSQVLLCPNLEELKKKLSHSPKGIVNIDNIIEIKCMYFQRHPQKQKFQCNEGHCKYIQKLEQDRHEFLRKLNLQINDIID